jgi:DNA-binding MarR family transcriptional regulator
LTDDEAVAAKAELSHEFIRYGRIIHLFRTQMADQLPTGLDPAAAQLLAWLAKQGPSRQADLAACTFLDPSTVSRQIRQLVQKGLVERRVDPTDGRASQLVPTARGEQLFDSMRRHREEILQRVLAQWSAAELSTLGGLLQKFNDDFETYRFQFTSPASEELHVRP